MIHALRRILDAVSAQTSFEEALQVLVTLVKGIMGADVASVFLYDEDKGDYVLMASDGLRPESVGKTRLRVNEGLVGLVGQREEPINLAIAADHPRFFYIPSTGEEAFRSFLSVPLIERKKVLGVLVAQRKEASKFSAADERFLITLAAQIAGVIVSSEARSAVFSRQQSSGIRSKSRFHGTGAVGGVALGKAFVVGYKTSFQQVEERRVDSLQQEIQAFDAACHAVRQDINQLRAQVCSQLKSSDLVLFDVYINMLEDDAFVGKVYDGIQGGSWAAGSLKRVVESSVASFRAMEDEYFRARASDIEDLGLRLLSQLLKVNVDIPEIQEPVILIGEDVSATMLLEWPRHQLAGVISLQGTSNSHMAIIARAIELPAVIGIKDLPLQLLHGQQLILDGFRGEVIVNPSEVSRQAYHKFLQQEQRVLEDIDAEQDQPAKTACGVDITVLANTGLLSDAKLALRRGARGVGLLRTEVGFMSFDAFPSEAEQVELYREHLEAFAPHPVSMRTLDIGGDKALPYYPIHETNPFLGWRGIRVTLDHPDIFMVQIRAMLKASIGLNNLRILLPMISGVEEVDEALRLIHRALAELHEEGFKVRMPKIGVMLEVPAAVIMARTLADRVDFLSVGTNDLVQYLLAVDRNNPRVANLYQAFHPAVIHTLSNLAQELNNFNIDLSVCGEIASDPVLAALLVGMGYRSLSMSAAALLRVKWVLRRLTLDDMEELVELAKASETSSDCKTAVLARMQALGIGEVVAQGMSDAREMVAS